MSEFAPIAVVGRACVLPGALSPAALWERVVAGDDLITQVPPGRWKVDAADVMCRSGDDCADRTYSDRGGYVDGFATVFDPEGFGIAAEEIVGLDPLFQWAFHTAREALRDAGHADDDPIRYGAIFGNLSFPSAGMADFVQATTLADVAPEPCSRPVDLAGARNRFMSGLPALLLERALGLGAGAFALDAACASSLYAIKLACDRLHDGVADLMLAGAVNCADDLFIHEGFTALNALSPSGRSRPFHRDADGLVPAEGCGFLALRRLDDAMRDGDTIHGVIRGVGLSNDGRGRGMLVPSVAGQARAMAEALAVAGLEPTDISLLECHATGTAVGDSTEVTSTAQVYATCSDLPIGSLKSNTGHLITAAGVAGVIKVIEAMRHEVRPPTLHVEQPVDALHSSPFRLLTEAEPWRRADCADGVLRAGVSAFGFGGNNAHVIIEEPASARSLAATPAARQVDESPIAIVGIGVTAAAAVGREAFTAALFGDVSCLDDDGTGRMPDIELRLADQKFPPNDLKAALGQQLAILQVTDEALADCGPLPTDRTGVYVGMGTDPQAARFGTRWRLPSLARAWGADPGWAEQARVEFGPALTAAGVLGSMPNLVANRLNSQYDVAGPSFTVSSEEHSGLDALAVAVRGLRAGDIDVALVGAVDLACDPAHREAAGVALPPDRHVPGDAAVMLVLKRLADADHDRVFAVIPGGAAEARAGDLRVGLGPDATSVTHLFGHAHAASGLLHVAAAAVMLHHRVMVGDIPLLASNHGGGLPSGAGPRTVTVATTAFDGCVARSILLAEASGHVAPSRVDAPRIHVYSGDDPPGVLEALAAGVESDVGPARLVIVAVDDEQLADRSRRARRHLETGHPPGVGVRFRTRPLRGEMAFVFTAGGAAYHGMGSQLLRALPEIAAPISSAFPLGAVSSWIFRPDHVPTPADYLWGTSLLSQMHARLTLDVLGLRPAAGIGYSSGESNMLFAFGVWTDNDAMRREIVECGMLDREIAGEFAAVARAWGEDRVDWTVWNVLAPVDEVRDAISDEPRVHLMLVNTDRDVVIGGDALACRRSVDALGAQRCRPVGYNLACHVPEVRAEFHQPWFDVHTRTVTPVDGVRFYSNGVGGAYEVSTEACAATITMQAETTVDFPATIRAAYDDGVRVFVEHGPSGACTNFISQILSDRDVLAVHLDRRDRDIEQVFDVCAELVAAGIAVDHMALTDRLTRDTPVTPSRDGAMISFPTRPTPPRLTDWAASAAQVMQLAPRLPAVLDLAESGTSTDAPIRAITDHTAAPPSEPDRTPVPTTGPGAAAATLAHQLTAMTEIHEAFVAQQAELHQRFLTTRIHSLGLLEVGDASTGRPGSSDGSGHQAGAVAVAAPPSAAPPDSDAPGTGPRGPVWGKEQLQIHSSGRISELFGPMFAPQDQYTLQCRMPEPPLLLADRVTGLDAEPGVLGTGTIWTETDVVRDAWYLNGGFMPAGFMIESGQADLMLISWMGIDLLNQGRRSYRLLGCTLTYHGDLPSVGETLEYEIRVTGHAEHGDIRLFFFEYECVVAGRPRLTVRDAQAGFFTRAELDDAQGVLWTPEAGRSALRDDARVDPPVVVGTKASFTADEVRAFSEGRVLDCFGPGFELVETHTRTPKIQNGRQLFIDEVTTFDPSGGPWGRGFMRCETSIADDAWFFDGHFKNDPCMPGNFMVEACIEAMSFYLAALGHTTRVDGWRFQPLPEQPFDLKCRGEINPQTDRVAYELYVEEVWAGPHPTIVCDVLGFVDGEPAFHAHRIGVELVPDWPLTTMPEIHEHVVEPVEVATDDEGFRFDWKAMISCAWGRPSEAFGSMYEVFDGTRRSPRLPGPPYHFMSRVVDVVGELGMCAAGMEIVCEYDIPDAAWYFDQNGAETMPFAVLLEAALQPCGWVASAVGSVTGVDEDMLFRNLDGTGTVVGELTRTAGTLTTRVELTSVSRAGGMIVEGFDVECRLGDRLVYTMETVFGFFPPEAFENQVGLAVTDDDRALHALAAESSDAATDLTNRPERYCSGTARLAGDMLLMVDRARHVAGAGSAGLGVVVGEKDVDVSEWFFKAHFFQDPVQPGSLGIEALLQLLQFFMLDTGMEADLDSPRFEPMLLGAPMVWKYRGQVTPENSMITTVMEIVEIGEDDRGRFVIGTGSLWCDGLRIYEVSNMGMRLVSGAAGDHAASTASAIGTASLAITVNRTRHPQLVDHAVDGTPVVPVVFVLEWFTRLAEAHRPDLHLVELVDLAVLNGIVADRYADGGDLQLVASVSESEATVDGVEIGLELRHPATGRLHYRGRARLSSGAPAHHPIDRESTGVGGAEPWPQAVYAGGPLFHGPAFRVIEDLRTVSDGGLMATLLGRDAMRWPDDGWVTDPALLDGTLQLALLWTQRRLDAPSLPTAIGRIRLFDHQGSGPHTARLVGVRTTSTMAVCDVSISSPDGTLVALIDGIETHVLPRRP